MSTPVTILVVDDDLLDRTTVRRALRASGLLAELVEAEDSAAALAALDSTAFDVILIDYRLPGTDGLELLRMVRARGVQSPIIVMTGQGDEQLAVEIMKAGATDYLAKGRMSAEALAGSVRHALRLHQAERQAVEASARHKQAEAALRQNERLLAIMLKSIGDAVIAADAAGLVIFMNAMAEQLTGWPAPEAIGQPLECVLPLGTAATPGATPSGVLLGGAAIEPHVETVARDRAGRRFPIVSSSAPIRGDEGAPVGVVVVFRDISERVRSEERLRFLAEMSQLLASSLDYQAQLKQLAQMAVPRFADFCAIDVGRADNTIQRLAAAVSEPLRAPMEPYLTLEQIDPDAPYGSGSVIRTSRAEYYPELAPELLARLSAEQRAMVAASGLVSWICVPLIVRGGILGALTFGRSIGHARYTPDDVHFAEEVARRAALAVDNALLYREAQDAIQARDAFLSIAAHELKTPLTSLLGYTELLERRFKRIAGLEERNLRILDVMIDQAHRLNKMVLALFDLSRLQTGQLNIERAPVELGALVARIVAEVEPTAERHALQLTLRDQPHLIIGDELRLEQVIQNLIQNAIKYSPEGGPIAIGVAHEGEWVRLSVQDHGLGIPHESLPRIFRRFYRAENAQPYQISGMGVGLYVAKQIVDLHGGRVEVESTEGIGSTFMVWLPRAEG